jgi:hypothetical protein
MELPLTLEELRHLLPSDLISEALEAQYLEDPPSYKLPVSSPFKFGHGELPPLESRIYQYLFQGTETWDRRCTFKLSEEIEVGAIVDSLRKEINELTGRRQVLILKSITPQRLAEEVSLQVQKLKRLKGKKGRVAFSSADKENIDPRTYQYL